MRRQARSPEDHEVDFKGRAHCTGASTGFAELT
jgi:hypothetical protein